MILERLRLDCDHRYRPDVRQYLIQNLHHEQQNCPFWVALGIFWKYIEMQIFLSILKHYLTKLKIRIESVEIVAVKKIKKLAAVHDANATFGKFW